MLCDRARVPPTLCTREPLRPLPTLHGACVCTSSAATNSQLAAGHRWWAFVLQAVAQDSQARGVRLLCREIPGEYRCLFLGDAQLLPLGKHRL